jgi:hypothetical protein
MQETDIYCILMTKNTSIIASEYKKEKEFEWGREL